MGLIAFGPALRARGWRILYLGADTPLESLAEAARSSRPDCVVISAVDPRSLDATRDSLVELAREYRIAVGGAAASEARLGEDILLFTGSPVDEADNLTQIEQRHAPASNTSGRPAGDVAAVESRRAAPSRRDRVRG